MTEYGAIQEPLFLDERIIGLLENAERIVYETECANHCVFFHAGRPCRDCGEFAPAANGYIACDGYRQLGELEAF